jgi:hypothetical protein
MTTDDAVRVLAAKQEIREVVLRYCRGVDRLDFDLVRSVYHPDGIDHHTGFDGTIDEYIPWVTTALGRFRGTMHIVGNQLVDLAGQRATCESYGTAVHWGDPVDDPRHNFTSGFRFVDDMRCIDGAWAIAERWAVREWTRSDAGRYLDKEGVGPSGRRDADDPLYRSLRAMTPANGTIPPRPGMVGGSTPGYGKEP